MNRVLANRELRHREWNLELTPERFLSLMYDVTGDLDRAEKEQAKFILEKARHDTEENYSTSYGL